MSHKISEDAIELLAIGRLEALGYDDGHGRATETRLTR
jgi:hypothetical protein